MSGACGALARETEMNGLAVVLALMLAGCASIDSMSDQKRVENEINVRVKTGVVTEIALP